MDFNEVQRHSEHIRLTESFRMLEKRLTEAVELKRMTESNPFFKLSREDVLAEIEKSDLHIIGHMSADSIIDKLNEKGMTYAGEVPLVEEKQGEYVEGEIGLSLEKVMDYMKQTMGNTKYPPSASGFIEYMQSQKLDEKDRPVLHAMENAERKFYESNEKRMLEEWLVKTLTDRNVDEAEHDRAVDYLKYREAGSLQYKMEKGVLVFGLMGIDGKVAEQYGNDSGGIVVNKTALNNENTKDADKENLRELGGRESEQWHELGGNADAVRQALSDFRHHGTGNQAEQEQELTRTGNKY